jgi:hypothetical protein
MCCAQDNIVGALVINVIVRGRRETELASVCPARHNASLHIESTRRFKFQNVDGLKQQTTAPNRQRAD